MIAGALAAARRTRCGCFTYDVHDASMAATSPLDGSLVYVEPAARRLFLANANGRNARMLFEVGEGITRVLLVTDGLGDDVATGGVSLVTEGRPVDWSWCERTLTTP
jgi:hypothetical protein